MCFLAIHVFFPIRPPVFVTFVVFTYCSFGPNDPSLTFSALRLLWRGRRS
jgi:hypothetical protein